MTYYNTVNTDSAVNTDLSVRSFKIQLKLRLSGTTNIYEDIYLQYKSYIAAGVFEIGEKLPSVRELGNQLGINPNTVERAYAMLIADGLAVSLHKKGVYVAEGAGKDVKASGSGAVIALEAQKQIAALCASGLEYSEFLAIAKLVYGKDNDKEDKK